MNVYYSCAYQEGLPQRPAATCKRIRNDQFWTSGTNLPLGQWVWMSSGEPLLPDYSDWEPGEPNNAGDERCLEFYEKDNNGYMWNDKNCMEQIYPICEYFE
ncbi:mannose binding [Homalodisca vitripennis]|nr:mannose binding [Homalodisca vitripennis]